MSALSAIFSAGPTASWFQIVAVTLLAGLILRDLLGASKVAGGLVVRVARCAVWIVAALAIRNPLVVQDAAELLGIGLGANLVLYLFVLAFLWVTFYQYSWNLKLQRELTTLVRHIAIQQATPPDPPAPPA